MTAGYLAVGNSIAAALYVAAFVLVQRRGRELDVVSGSHFNDTSLRREDYVPIRENCDVLGCSWC